MGKERDRKGGKKQRNEECEMKEREKGHQGEGCGDQSRDEGHTQRGRRDRTELPDPHGPGRGSTAPTACETGHSPHCGR